jgi:hypothetical protein
MDVVEVFSSVGFLSLAFSTLGDSGTGTFVVGAEAKAGGGEVCWDRARNSSQLFCSLVGSELVEFGKINGLVGEFGKINGLVGVVTGVLGELISGRPRIGFSFCVAVCAKCTGEVEGKVNLKLEFEPKVKLEVGISWMRVDIFFLQ